jgi:hypothetical protein
LPSRRDHEPPISDARQSLDLQLGQAIKSLESNLMARFSKIDEKISGIEAKLNDLSGQISQNRAADDEKPLHVNVNAIVEAMNVELITSLNEIYQSVDEIDKKVAINRNMLAQNYATLVTIGEHLHADNQTDHFLRQQQQQRKERGLDHSRLISDILSMVRNRLHGDNNSTTAAASLPVLGNWSRDYEANRRHNGSSTLRAKNATAAAAAIENDTEDDAKLASQNKKGIIFPSVKNKPSKMNMTTTFMSDAVGYKDKDIKVRLAYLSGR